MEHDDYRYGYQNEIRKKRKDIIDVILRQIELDIKTGNEMAVVVEKIYKSKKVTAIDKFKVDSLMKEADRSNLILLLGLIELLIVRYDVFSVEEQIQKIFEFLVRFDEKIHGNRITSESIRYAKMIKRQMLKKYPDDVKRIESEIEKLINQIEFESCQ